MEGTDQRFDVAERRRSVVESAKRYLGFPYVREATLTDPPTAFDCSLLIQYVYRGMGILLPRRSVHQAEHGVEIPTPSLDCLEAADLLYFTRAYPHYSARYPQGIGHVVLYAGDGMIIHATSNGWRKKGASGVVREPADLWLERGDLIVARRLLT